MNTSVTYAVARAKMHAPSLLSQAKTERLLGAANGEEALKILSEFGFVGGNLEQMLLQEQQRVTDFFFSVCPDRGIAEAFLLENDYLSLKLLFKARLANQGETVSVSGVIGFEKLKGAVRDREYKRLPPVMREACAMAEESIAVGGRPAAVDNIFDRALYRHRAQICTQIRNQTVKQYFSNLTDYKNLSIALRAKSLGFSADSLRDMLLEGGAIAPKQLLLAYADANKLLVLYTVASKKGLDDNVARAAREGIRQWQQDGSLALLERLADDGLLDLFKEKKQTNTEIEPFVGYYLARLRDIGTVRLIITGKNNGFDAVTMKERLRAFYV